jgi:competence protein ComFC
VSILDLFYPKFCLGCGRLGGYFCADCRSKQVTSITQICPICAKPAIGGMAHPVCAGGWRLDGLTAVFPYRGMVKQAITQVKYGFAFDLADSLVRMLIGSIDRESTYFLNNNETWILAPVPLWWQRKNWRGFNQAEILGESVAKKLGLKYCRELLLRQRKTEPQVNLKREGRLGNLKKAFSINPKFRGKINGRSIVLFDDVWTTGATLRECGLVLKKAGAARVWGLTIAR